jgi:uncharacterized membrane protein required for colicin V production
VSIAAPVRDPVGADAEAVAPLGNRAAEIEAREPAASAPDMQLDRASSATVAAMDVLLVILVAGFAVGGLRTGFLRSLLGLVFMALAFVLGAYLRHPVGALASRLVKDVPAAYADMLGFAFVFLVTLVAAHLIARPLFANVAARGLSRVTDQALGAIFGGLEAILIISAAIVILDTYFGTKAALAQTVGLGFLDQVTASLNASTTAHLLRNTTVPFVLAVLGPLLPTDLTTLLPRGLPSVVPGNLPLPGGIPIPSL